MINVKLFTTLFATLLVILAVVLGTLYYAHEDVVTQRQQITHAANEQQKGSASFHQAAEPATEAAPAVQNPWAQPKR
ncbi:MAG: hypothetical protein ACREFN_16115 [Acetobacteraceae bacterium]